MAINNIPGVGPQNSDIAAAVAAPSAATIAAAVAAPSAATIAAAVAAPSLASITSTVQSNAGSPFGGSWTLLSSQNPGTATVTFSGLSGYKKYRLCIAAYNTSGSYQLSCAVNNLGTGHYYTTRGSTNSNAIAFYTSGSPNAGGMNLLPGQSGAGFIASGVLDFEQASSSGYKTIDWTGQYFLANANLQMYAEGKCFVKDTAAINRIDIITSANAAAVSSSGFWLFGGN